MHFNRLIKKYDLDAYFVSGPGHGAPAVLSQSYLEGVYEEVYPDKSQDVEGMQRFFKWFSFPGGIGSHATPETPGSIHEGGELGYSISHAFGSVFDHPDLIALTVVGDGEAETGPLATSWHSNKFLNPVTDGVVLPVLNLNGYKINNPTLLARISHKELENLFLGYGWTPYFVEGDDLDSMHQAMAATLEQCVTEIRKYQQEARESAQQGNKDAHLRRPRWPMIVLRTPKGWTGPRKLDDKYLAGYWRAHQVPITDVRTNPEHLKLLEAWMRSYEPERLFGKEGRISDELRNAICPAGNRRMSANPVANGGQLKKPLKLPDFRNYKIEFDQPAQKLSPSMTNLAGYLRDVMASNPKSFRLFGPDETESNKLAKVYEAGEKVWMGEYFPEDADGGHLSPYGRVMEILSEHTCEGWLEGYVLSGRHGLLNSYEPFIHVIDSMVNQVSVAKTALILCVQEYALISTTPANSTASGSRNASKSNGASKSPPLTSSSPLSSGAKTTTASRTKTQVSSMSWPTSPPKWSAFTCHRTATVSSPAWTTVSSPPTMSTSSSPTSKTTCSTCPWRPPSSTAQRASASGRNSPRTQTKNPTLSWPRAATFPHTSPLPPSTCSCSTSPISRSAASTALTCSSSSHTRTTRTV